MHALLYITYFVMNYASDICGIVCVCMCVCVMYMNIYIYYYYYYYALFISVVDGFIII